VACEQAAGSLTAPVGPASQAGRATGLPPRHLDVSQPSLSERPLSQTVHGQYPFSQHAGQHVWIRSLLDTCRRAGWSIDLLVPSASLLPLLVGQSAQLRVHAPGLRAVTARRSVTTGGAAARQAAWVAFTCAPQPIQRRLASARRRRRGAQGVDHVLGHPWTPSELRWIDDMLAALQPTVVVFDTLFALAPTAQGVRRLALAHDVISERAASLARAGYRTVPAFVDRAWEAQQADQVDAIVAIQWEDAVTLRRMAAQPHVVVAPPAFEPPTRTRPSDRGDSRKTCLFVGSGSLHNVDGLQWFLKQVWPAVHVACPSAEFRVVGTAATQVASGHPGVTLVGEVDDLAAEYWQADVVVVPLRSGSGLKLKLVEAINEGCPVVTTPAGAQGLGGIEPAPFKLADTADQFALEVVAVLDEPERRAALSRQASKAAAHFHPPGVHAELMRLLDDDP
jgi:Glycosyl transferases group 1